MPGTPSCLYGQIFFIPMAEAYSRKKVLFIKPLPIAAYFASEYLAPVHALDFSHGEEYNISEMLVPISKPG